MPSASNRNESFFAAPGSGKPQEISLSVVILRENVERRLLVAKRDCQLPIDGVQILADGGANEDHSPGTFLGAKHQRRHGDLQHQAVANPLGEVLTLFVQVAPQRGNRRPGGNPNVAKTDLRAVFAVHADLARRLRGVVLDQLPAGLGGVGRVELRQDRVADDRGLQAIGPAGHEGDLLAARGRSNAPLVVLKHFEPLQGVIVTDGDSGSVILHPQKEPEVVAALGGGHADVGFDHRVGHRRDRGQSPRDGVVAGQAKLAVLDRPISVLENRLPAERPGVEPVLQEHSGVIGGARRQARRKQADDDCREEKKGPASNGVGVQVA